LVKFSSNVSGKLFTDVNNSGGHELLLAGLNPVG
jgi:hypothetical protein